MAQSRFIDYGTKFPNGVEEFDLGMTTNPRSASGAAKIIKHFDNYSDSQKLTPHRSMICDDGARGMDESTLDGYRIQKVVATNKGLYGFGVVSSSDAHAQVYVKVTPTDPTSAWTTANSGHDSGGNGGSAGFKLFLEYHNYLYGDNAGGIWKYGDITGSPSFTYNDFTSAIPTGQGIVHSLDDTMYVPCGNTLARNDNGSWDTPLTFNNGTIADIWEDGSYIGIMVNQYDGKVIVYLWDRDSSLETLTSKFDFGYGTGVLGMNLGGILCGIVISSQNSTSLTPHVYFKYVSGTDVKVFQDFNVTAAFFTGDKQQFNNIFYFSASMTLNGETLQGVWKIVKTIKNALVVSFDRLPRNDTTLDVGTLKGFYRWGDYMFVFYLIPSLLTYTIWRTDDQPNYLATSTYETTIFNQILGLRNKRIPDSSIVKKLVGATLTNEALPAGAAIALSYRIQGQTEWTLIFQHSNEGDIDHSAINIEDTGENLPENKEIEFQWLSTGGAEITGFEFTQEIIGKRNY